MLFTLHRYVFRELLRVFILASLALTLILSLGSILQPIQEYGVGPRQVVYLMGYFLPITLTFVLPMAALFSGALVYGRLASDNELDACRASGISLPAMTYPGLALAMIVAIANLLLSFYVMPVFVHRAETSFKADAKQILFRNIERRRYYELPPDNRYLIYADKANLQTDTLLGVVVTEMKDNRIENIIMAEAAKVTFSTTPATPTEPTGRTSLQITAVNSGQMGAEGEGGAQLGSLTKEVGSLLGDEINFKKIGEMRRIQTDPMQFYPIEQLANETYAQLIVELLADDIKRKTPDSRPESGVPSPDSPVWYDLPGEPTGVKFTARQCQVRDTEVVLSGDVLVMEYQADDKQPLRTQRCPEASLHLEGDPITLTAYLKSPQEIGSSQLRMRPYVISGLLIPDAVETKAAEFKTRSGSLQPQKLASTLSQILEFQPSRALTGLQGKLQRLIRKTLVQIKAEIHSRLVFGTGCVPMIMIGIGLGILKKGGHLLSAFGASCVPAAVLIICIMSGKQLTQNLGAQTVSGVALMWGGMGFLTLLTLGIYTRLLRH